MQYPSPLKPGSTIAITAFSSGVPKACHQRLELVISHLKSLGFIVIEGQCLREDINHVSADKAARAQELMSFLCDDGIDAVFPPWGGEFAMEILPLLDFERLASVKPKWVMGFSDVSTVMVALTTRLGWASVHAANLLQLYAKEQERLTASCLDWLGLEVGSRFTQDSTALHERVGRSFADDPSATLNLTEPTFWKTIDGTHSASCQGRLIGGCFDTMTHLIGTSYFDVEAFSRRHQEGVILYLENAEMSPSVLKRALLSLQFKGVFDVVNGLVLGRNAVIGNAGKAISGEQALLDVLSELSIPVIYDADIGHLPPNLTLINGAYAEVSVVNGVGKVTQTLK
ncbi:LD-carboxypeptidase [Vibrio sp. T187]|uniref:S66 family peptidase n=1 Tax=Vibrio TaxID=662 RepID=UPI0010CA07B3|nr:MULTISPECIES: S66 peptidase family protein [Vibrio]MBW3695052.1 LD-carboxypeptidase [Vibrio sp. T187]